MSQIKNVFLFTIFVMVSLEGFASHIRALEITARRISSATLTFEFTVTGYQDIDGVDFSNGEFRFGDGSAPQTNIPWVLVEEVGNSTAKWQFVLSHTFSSAGAYTVSYKESFRNNGVVNMSNSSGTDYFTETLIIIDPLVGINSTPILTVPPIDLAASGLIFIHNPGAFDEDGDSLAYKFSIPLQDNDVNVTGYLSPIDPSFYSSGFATANQNGDGPPTLILDPAVGDLIWDAPGMAGEYNISFIVEEWREINGQYFRLGYVTRDMQIIVEETDNQAPELIAPDELCVAAGTSINDTIYEPDIIGTDPDNDPVTLSAFGGPFEIPGGATYQPDPPVSQGPPGFLEFFWDTDCSHIRERPYEVRLKIEDNPSENPTRTESAPKLVDFETWNISVVGPAPTGLLATPLPGRRIQLDWDSYMCPNTGASMEIWRRVGEFDFTPEECEIGIPSGYELVTTLPIDSDVYIDNNDGLGLAGGANYCYRLVASFADPLGGTSYASNESCTEIVSNAPLITKVDVLSTSETTGETRIEWIDPPEIDGVLFPGPYSYDLLRATGSTTNTAQFALLASNLSDTFYDDSGLNTDDNPYSYMVIMYDNTLMAVDTSFAAATVRLDLQSRLGAIEVRWDALVPWSIEDQDFPIHEIYRDQMNSGNPDDLVLIATVDVTQSGLTYLDDGSHNGVLLDEEISYCYYVRTQGSYDSDNVAIPEPLVNTSQVQCAQPNDDDAPCTPINLMFADDVSCEVLLQGIGCEVTDFLNRFSWEQDISGECGDDVESFNIYFSPTGAEGSYVFLANTIQSSFDHTGINSFNGCYQLTSVDRSGNESERSEPICNENCIKDQNGDLRFQLPNVFTPNGDGVNETFRAFGDNDPDACPRFVLSVDFVVIDRTGKQLYSYNTGLTENEDDFFINWDGRNNAGKRLAAGTYFYSAIVRFDTRDPSDAVQNLNGWVQILR